MKIKHVFLAGILLITTLLTLAPTVDASSSHSSSGSSSRSYIDHGPRTVERNDFEKLLESKSPILRFIGKLLANETFVFVFSLGFIAFITLIARKKKNHPVKE